MAAGGTTILVADDDVAVRQILKSVLAGVGSRIVVAGDGQEAMAVAMRVRPRVAILDVRMPPPNGIEVCAWLKQAPTPAQTKVIVLTGFVDPTTRSRALAAGADAFMSKPFSPIRLRALVEDLLGLTTDARLAV